MPGNHDEVPLLGLYYFLLPIISVLPDKGNLTDSTVWNSGEAGDIDWLYSDEFGGWVRGDRWVELKPVLRAN